VDRDRSDRCERRGAQLSRVHGIARRAIQSTADALDKAGEAFATVAGAFNGGTITTSFVSYATTITNSQRFQFATLKQMEIFTRTEEPSTAFGYVPLPDVAVEARAPVEFTYYLDLNESGSSTCAMEC